MSTRSRTTCSTTWSASSLRVHVINDPELSLEIFGVSEERFWHAFAAAPELGARVELTVGLGEEGLWENVAEAEAIIAFQYPHREVMARAPRLRWIHQTGAGISHLLPLDWLPDHVVLTNSRGVHEQKAGEYAACALLMLNNLIPIYVTNQRKQRWVQEFNNPIDGRTVVIVGVGHMGAAAARRARQLGLRVIGLRRSAAAHPDFDAVYPIERLHDVLPEADFVLVTAPLTAETEGLIGAAELDLLKPTAGLVNMGRARIVDYDALAKRLRARRLRGAILDVFEPEPLPDDSPLWHCDNLVISPHASSDSLDYAERVLAIFVDNFRRLLAGEPLRNRVDPATAY